MKYKEKHFNPLLLELLVEILCNTRNVIEQNCINSPCLLKVVQLDRLTNSLQTKGQRTIPTSTLINQTGINQLKNIHSIDDGNKTILLILSLNRC